MKNSDWVTRGWALSTGGIYKVRDFLPLGRCGRHQGVTGVYPAVKKPSVKFMLCDCIHGRHHRYPICFLAHDKMAQWKYPSVKLMVVSGTYSWRP